MPKSEIEIDFHLNEKEFGAYIDRAIEHFRHHTKMDGFRPGKAPKDIVERQVGQENLLTEAGDLAVKESYAKFVNENNLEPVGSTDVQIKHIARGSEFLFTVKVAVLPEIELPDYKSIIYGIKNINIEVNEKEIEDALNYLQKSRAKFSQISRGAEKKDFVEIEYENENLNGGKPVKDKFILGEGGFLKDFEDNILGMASGEKKEFTAKFPENAPGNLAGIESRFKVTMISVQKMDIPEISDEFAKSLGVFDSLVSLKENLKEGITMEKNESERQRKRGEMLNKISEKIKFELPLKMVEYEEERLVEDLKNHVANNLQTPFDDYLKSVKKTEEEVKKSLRIDAERRIKNFLVLRQIGKAENIEVPREELEDEMNKEIRKYTKEQVEKIDIAKFKEYIKGIVFNEKVFQLLEKPSHQ